ncbi:MAG: hypothetical protein IAA97_05285 [Spirochaetes bacterium]|uniref:Uncharacterized protein n=1 Tax=Candidatus Ornithospirochaeta stercoripullorum TaxID=2840899 RepID=A0A9D9H4S6_9SPIO|nr:hypothetical protein [Candidatus Ornithospirochaeta stercoripullorum]
MPELFLFCLAKALQVKLQLNAERTHRSVSCTGFLAVLLDGIVFLDVSNSSPPYRTIEDGVFLLIFG